MIFLVVFGHLIEPIIKESNVIKVMYMSIYSFHMPVFILLSGMLSNIELTEKRIKKYVFTLLVPFLVFTVLYEIFNMAATGKISHYTLNFQPYWILWFLLSMFIWKIFLPVIMQFRYPLILSILISLGAGFVSDIGYFLGLSRTLYFFPFFVLGYQLGAKGLSNKYLQQLPKSLYFLIIVLNIVIFWVYKDIPHQWLYGSNSYSALGSDNIEGLVIRTCLYLISFTTAISILKLIPSNNIKVSHAGQNTLSVYIWHGFFVKTAMYFGIIQMLGNISTPFALSSIFVFSILLTAILSTDFITKITHNLLLLPLKVIFLKVSYRVNRMMFYVKSRN